MSKLTSKPSEPAKPIFALVDVNNFYVSCERAFEPRLQNVPMVVLSNNDGCAVARSQEVKDLGIKMSQPWFKMKDLAQQHGIVAYSSNYALYGDMSNRATAVLRQFCPDIEVYSIDESFLQVQGLAPLYGGHTRMGQSIRQRVLQWTGLPVCVGFGPTKTLAKFANHLAKKNPAFAGVCDLASFDTPTLSHWMAQYPVTEVWGVGRRIGERLKTLGVATIQDLASIEPKILRNQFGVVLERTAHELRGTSCLALEDVLPDKQQIMSSRSFGKPVVSHFELAESVSWHVAAAGEKLRRQSSFAGAIYVFVQTNRFREDQKQYNAGLVMSLPEATNDTLALTKYALRVLKRLYRPDYIYKKCGIMLMDLSEQMHQQTSLIASAIDPRSIQKMQALDAINERFGRGMIRSAACGTSKRWAMRSEARSPRYTTQWDELPVAQ